MNNFFRVLNFGIGSQVFRHFEFLQTKIVWFYLVVKIEFSVSFCSVEAGNYADEMSVSQVCDEIYSSNEQNLLNKINQIKQNLGYSCIYQSV